MPRDGSFQFHVPPGTDGITNFTIESTKYNTFVHDIEQDQNNPRPIVAGGTGASDAHSAMVNLNGEIAAQQVTNYDSFPFANGSFYSQPGATSQPVNSNVTGSAVIVANDPNYINIIATDNSTGITYLRHKTAGVWSGWVLLGSATAVQKTGDTMSGALTISMVQPTLTLDKSAGGQAAQIFGKTVTLNRWVINLGDTVAESGSNVGSNFSIQRFSDAGAPIGEALNINRASGVVTATTGLSANGNIVANVGSLAACSSASTGSVYFGSNLTQSIQLTGGTFAFSGAPLAPITVGTSAAAPTSAAILVSYNGTTQFGLATRPVADNSYAALFYNAAGTLIGNILTSPTATAYNTSSDVRLKDSLETFDAGRIIDATDVYSFRWKSTGERSYGVSAQQANEVYPEAVTHKEDEDWWGVDYSKYVPVLLQELKALRARVAELEGRLAAKPAHA